MSEYLDNINASYDQACTELGSAISAIINQQTGLNIINLCLGDVITHTCHVHDTTVDLNIMSLNTYIKVDIGDVYTAHVTSPSGHFNGVIPIEFTDEMKVMYENMMLGSKLWAVYHEFTTNTTPSLIDDTIGSLPCNS